MDFEQKPGESTGHSEHAGHAGIVKFGFQKFQLRMLKEQNLWAFCKKKQKKTVKTSVLLRKHTYLQLKKH